MDHQEPLDLKRIEERLRPGHFFHALHVVEEATSTNEILAARAREKGLKEGVLLVAEEQTAGKGRLGRSWYSAPRQSLTFSFLCPNFFPRQPGRITVGLAVACAAALERETGLTYGIKWPNDLFLKGRKLAGILGQNLTGPGGDLMVMGVGINVNAKPVENPSESDTAPICLKDELGRDLDRSLLLAALLDEIGDTMTRFEKGEARFVVEGLRKRSILMGAQAKFEWKRKTYEGKVTDHTDDLEIRLETSDGIVDLPGETSLLLSFHRA